MLNVFILDDERLAVERLERLLRATGRVTIAGATTEPEAALAFLRTHDVDLLFLDIQMPGLTGFQLIEQLERDIPVVFTTAYDRYAVEAFTVNSVDYLLKPIEPERLARALDKASRASDQPRSDARAVARELARLLGGGALRERTVSAGVTGRPDVLERIASRLGDRTTILDVARIVYFFSKDKLTFAVSGAKDHAIDYSLTELEARLDRRRFVRIHRSTIVNAAFVQELDAWVDGGVLVRLKDDKRTELMVARDRVRELKEKLGI